MRPVPKPRHTAALLVFIAVSATCGYFAMVDDRLSPTQVDLAAAAMKRHQPDLFPSDPVLGRSELWRMHSPVLYGVLEMFLYPTGYSRPDLPFRMTAGVVLMIYLCGMYALLYRQCRSWSVACFASVLSSAVTPALGEAYWGVGSLASITPTGVAIALTPMILMAFLHNATCDRPAHAENVRRHRWRLVLVFGCIGLMGNIHLPMTIALAIVLLVAYMGTTNFRLASWPVAAGGALAVAIGALPYIAYFLTVRSSMTPPGAAANLPDMHQALQLARVVALYPQLLKSMLEWLPYLAGISIPAIVVLVRLERFRMRDTKFWIWFIATALFVSVAMQGLYQLFGTVLMFGPPILALVGASALVMPALYVLFAQALTNLFRLVRDNRYLIRWACAAIAVAWMVPSDNFHVGRHLAYETATLLMPEDKKPLRVQQLHAQADARAELERIAAWARENTPVSAVFVTLRGEFRMLARRSLAASRDDVAYFYKLAPWRMRQWTSLAQAQMRLFQKPPDALALTDFRQTVSQVRGSTAADDWYIILPAAMATELPESLVVGGNGSWGERYGVYRIPAPPELSPH